MKLLIVAVVAVLVGVAMSTQGFISALAELLAFSTVLIWAWKTKKNQLNSDKNEAHIEPHV